MNEKFDNVFKNYGGYYEPIVPLQEIAVKGFNNTLDILLRSDPRLPPVNIGLVNNVNLGGVASKFEGEYFIGIFGGTSFLLRDTFYRMLSFNNILPEFGDVTVEIEGNRIFNPQITDLGILSYATPLDEHNNPIHPCPIHPQRQILAEYLYVIASKFILMHEYAHINFGHVDYLNDKGDANWTEFSPNFKGSNRIDPLFSQTLELDSDCFATSYGIKEILNLMDDPENIREELLFIFKDYFTAFRIWLFAIYAMFRLCGYIVPKLENLNTFTHPPAGLRQRIVAGTFHTILQIYKEEFLCNFGTVWKQTVNDVEDAFQKISETNLNRDSINFALGKESHDHVEKLMRNWNNVRPHLEPYTHGGLAPYFTQ